MEKPKVVELKGRVGNWMQTYTSKQFWPLDPRAEDICIEDIAHALSLVCRYGGHCNYFYSVAEHSVIVSRHVGDDRNTQLWGLLHDAAEAYIGDMVRPLKKQMPAYQECEARIMRCIVERLGLEGEEPQIVKEIDNRLLLREKALLRGPEPAPWSVRGEPLNVQLRILSPIEAEGSFLERYEVLRGK